MSGSQRQYFRDAQKICAENGAWIAMFKTEDTHTQVREIARMSFIHDTNPCWLLKATMVIVLTKWYIPNVHTDRKCSF